MLKSQLWINIFSGSLTQFPRILMFGPSVDSWCTNQHTNPPALSLGLETRIIDMPVTQICYMRHYSDLFLSRSKWPRMYNSCYTCRRRRIQCEMTGPPCRKCENAGLECFQKRPLRWVDGAEFRAKAKRRGASTVAANVRADNVRTRTVDNAEYDGVFGLQLYVLSSSNYGGQDSMCH